MSFNSNTSDALKALFQWHSSAITSKLRPFLLLSLMRILPKTSVVLALYVVKYCFWILISFVGGFCCRPPRASSHKRPSLSWPYSIAFWQLLVSYEAQWDASFSANVAQLLLCLNISTYSTSANSFSFFIVLKNAFVYALVFLWADSKTFATD